MTHFNKRARLVIAIMVVMFCLTSAKLNAQYISSSVDWVGDTVIYPGSQNNKQFRLRIDVGPTPISIHDVNFNTNGSTNPVNDISNCDFWFTGSVDTFDLSSANLISSVPNPWFTNFTFLTAPFTTISGANYFWMSYDTSPNAIVCDFTSAEIITFIYGSTNIYPTNPFPIGSSVIGNNCLSGINESETKIEFTVFPNPSSENIQLNYSNIPHEKIEINIFDPAGRKIKNLFSGINSAVNFEKQFSIEELNSGFYFIVVEGESVYRQMKIVKL